MATQKLKAAKYVSVGRLIYRAKGDGLDKEPQRTFGPGDPIDIDLTPAEIERFLAKGSIREIKLAKAEEEAREAARAAQEEARKAQEEADATVIAAKANEQATAAKAAEKSSR